mgnify:CR=1 FL=1
MSSLTIGPSGEWKLKTDGTNMLIEHLPTGNTWEFAPNGDFDIPADLTGRVDKTIYDGTQQKLTVENTESSSGSSGGGSQTGESRFYATRRVQS